MKHLYVHVPFCARRCTYCDFSIAVRARTPVTQFVEGVAAELGRMAPAPDRSTVYFGGGTPSRLGAEGIWRLARAVGAREGLDEFTIEANPEDVTLEAVRGWVKAGVNRLSLGAQSFDDRVLEWMHRVHDAAAIGRAVAAARDGGIGNLSLDLIFSLPDALGRDWRRDLERAIALDPEHISLYGLTIETGTPLARQMLRGQSLAAPDTKYEAEYLAAHQVLGAAGYAFYEVSNAARPGREAIHNRAYWRLAPYLGLGPSAHSFDGAERWWNEPAYAAWQKLVASGSSPIVGREALGPDENRMERLYLGLRTTDGIELTEDLKEKAERWARAGWVSQPPTPQPPTRRLALTPTGWLRLDQLVAAV